MDFWPTLVAAVVALVTTQSLQIAAPNLQGEKTMRWDTEIARPRKMVLHVENVENTII